MSVHRNALIFDFFLQDITKAAQQITGLDEILLEAKDFKIDAKFSTINSEVVLGRSVLCAMDEKDAKNHIKKYVEYDPTFNDNDAYVGVHNTDVDNNTLNSASVPLPTKSFPNLNKVSNILLGLKLQYYLFIYLFIYFFSIILTRC